MLEIWAKLLLPNALNGCPKCKKSPNLVTLVPFSSLTCGQPYKALYERKLQP